MRFAQQPQQQQQQGQPRPGQPPFPGQQQQQQQQNKQNSIIPNPVPAGLPIAVGGGAPNETLHQQGGPGQSKVLPSPSLANKPGPGSMPPPSSTPNHLQQKDKLMKEEDVGSAKSSPNAKPAANPNPSTPVPPPMGPSLSSGPFGGSSVPSPSPGAILAQAQAANQTPPTQNVSRPGSTVARGGPAPPPPVSWDAAAYADPTFINSLIDYPSSLDVGSDPSLALTDADFDKYFLSDMGMAGMDDDMSAAAGGS